MTPPPAPTQQAAPTPATLTVAPGRHTYSFQCTSSNQVLRVTLDGDDATATISRIRRPNITLRAQQGGARGFRYTNDDYELSGDYSEILFRTGNGEPVRCRRGG